MIGDLLDPGEPLPWEDGEINPDLIVAGPMEPLPTKVALWVGRRRISFAWRDGEGSFTSASFRRERDWDCYWLGVLTARRISETVDNPGPLLVPAWRTVEWVSFHEGLRAFWGASLPGAFGTPRRSAWRGHRRIGALWPTAAWRRAVSMYEYEEASHGVRRSTRTCGAARWSSGRASPCPTSRRCSTTGGTG